jgi:hypothetical protein
MSENDQSPAWLLPLIVIILIASVVLLFIASRPGISEQSFGLGASDFREGSRFRLPQLSSLTEPVDPCSLVSQTQIEDAMGRELSEPISEDLSNPYGEMLCVFTAPDDPDERLLAIDMVFQSGMASVFTQNDYTVAELYRGRRIEDQGVEDVEGIEDEAFWGGAGTEIWNGLHVRSADVYMRVLVYAEEENRALEVAREVAVIVLRNLFG